MHSRLVLARPSIRTPRTQYPYATESLDLKYLTSHHWYYFQVPAYTIFDHFLLLVFLINYQSLRLKLQLIKVFLKSLNFINFTTITKQLILILLAWWSSCGRKPEYLEETHLSDLVTKWPSHMTKPGIEPGLQQWEASVLTLYF